MITQGKIGMVYGVFIVIFLGVVVFFLLCDFQVLSGDTCQQINNIINKVTNAVSEFLNL